MPCLHTGGPNSTKYIQTLCSIREALVTAKEEHDVVEGERRRVRGPRAMHACAACSINCMAVCWWEMLLVHSLCLVPHLRGIGVRGGWQHVYL